MSVAQKIPLRLWSKSTFVIYLTLAVLGLITVVGLLSLDTKGVNLWEATLKTLDDLRKMFFEPVLDHLTIVEALEQLGVTLALAFLTTMIGAVISLFLSFFAAQNLGNKYFGPLLTSFIAVVRAIPTVLWVLIFAIGAGLGAVAAVIGMAFHTVGYLLKAYSESFEDLDHGVIEALKASGATWWQIIFQAVLPSSLTMLLAWTFIRFEINFTIAVAMGAAAGAGGIGFDLFMASAYYFNIREVGTITWLILLVALAMELFANYLRHKNRLHV